jgi:hypothetical protein
MTYCIEGKTASEMSKAELILYIKKLENMSLWNLVKLKLKEPK